MKHLHEKRGVTFQELGALLGVRGLLALKLVTHAKTSMPSPGKHQMSMNVACKTNGDCGSVGCIGGTMAFLMGKSSSGATWYVGLRGRIGEASPAFQELFFPKGIEDWDTITTEHMLKAIDNWLGNGHPRWVAVCAKKKAVKKPSRSRPARKKK